jgi:hypothetical protein
MPVRSLSSSVFAWPDARTVDRAVRQWAARMVRKNPGVVRLGYIGSYARGDWGVGSDLDLVAIVRGTTEPFERRAAAWDATDLPVPADVLVYSLEEWERLRGTRFWKTVAKEAVWVFESG